MGQQLNIKVEAANLLAWIKRFDSFDGLFAFLMAANFMDIAQAEPRVIKVNNPGPNDKVDILQLRQNGGGQMDGQMRNALKSNAATRWTKYRKGKSKYLIPYIITGSFSQSEQQIIRRAMHSIDKNTCVRFKARSGEADYVDIQNKAGQGCFTMVGMERGHNQLMLESSSGATCISYVTVLHELMHKLGLWHEQMRYDRDKYIKVHWENIPDEIGYRYQFEKIPKRVSTVYGVRYDYRSAMHYTKNAFAKRPNLVSMETRNRKYQNVIGNAQRASKGDWKKICGIYRCGRCMGKTVGKRKTTKGKRRKSGGSGGRRRRRTRTENINKWFSRDSPTLLASANANGSMPMGEELPMPAGGKNSNSSSSSAEANDEGDSSNSAGDSSENEEEDGEESEEDEDDMEEDEDEEEEEDDDDAGDVANDEEESEEGDAEDEADENDANAEDEADEDNDNSEDEDDPESTAEDEETKAKLPQINGLNSKVLIKLSENTARNSRHFLRSDKR